MEIQAALMLAYQIQDGSKEVWNMGAAPTQGMEATERLKACKGIRPRIELLALGESTAENRDGFIGDAIEENDLPTFSLKRRPQSGNRMYTSRVPRTCGSSSNRISPFS
jgi:hypothetical protein